jgi:signal transduction histidine kinase
VGERRSGGLGLLIAGGLATANGGTLALLNRPGGGTIARLILPAAPTLEPTVEPTREETA